MLYFTPYRISTITCNADIGEDINMNLSVLFENIKIENDTHSFVWIQFLKENEERVRGQNIKKKKKNLKENSKNRFDNQITVLYKFSENYYPNIKIFKNGNIQMTGIRDLQHPEIIINKIIDNIKCIYTNIDKNIILTNYNDIEPLSRLKYSNFMVRMINSDFKIFYDIECTEKFNIKRKDLHNILIGQKYNNKSSFQPGVYQGVKLEYYWNTENKDNNGICKCTKNCFGKKNGTGNGNCKKVTIAIFESGSVLITGGVTFEQINTAYDYICNIIKDNQLLIKKSNINKELII